MAINTNIQDAPLAGSIIDNDGLLGTRNNNDGTYSDYRYTAADLKAYLSKKITALTANISDAGATLTDPFFANPITVIITDTVPYIIMSSFTQDTTAKTITYTNGATFTDGQIFVAQK